MTINTEVERKTFAQAMFDALDICLSQDKHLTINGDWIFGLQHIGLMDVLKDKHPGRVLERPCAEAVGAALGIGAAMAGVPSIVELATGSFSFLAWSQIVNEASVAHYLSNGQLDVPVVFNIMHGIRGGGGAQHSISPQSMLWSVPGLEIVLPSSPADVKGLLLSAIRSRNPTVFVEHVKLMGIEGDVPVGDQPIPFGRADIKRSGDDVTLVATSYQVQRALNVAATLTQEGISVEVVDPRTLVPFDEQTIIGSVRKTGRLAVLDEGNLRCGVASEIVATVAEKAHDALVAPPLRLARADTPVPFSSTLEAAMLPSEAEIGDAIRHLMAQR